MSQDAPSSDSVNTAGYTGRHPWAVLATMGVLEAATFGLDLGTDPSINIPILYNVIILLSYFSPWDRTPFLSGSASVVLTFIPPLFLWPPPLDWFILLNRGIAAAAITITTLLVSDRKNAVAHERTTSELLAKTIEKRTAELRALNEALESEIDIRRCAETSLLESQDRLAKTQEFSLVMVTHVGLDGRWLKVPLSLCKLLGYSEAELLAHTFMNVTHPDDVEADWSQCQRIVCGEIKSFELEKRYIRKDKNIVWVYLNCSGVYDRDGRLLHFLTYIQDISDRKRVEQVLHESEKRWRTVIETVPIGIAISTIDGRVLDVNTAAWKILGYDSKEEFLRLTAASHYLNPADRQRRIEQIRAGRHVFEAQYKKKDGTLFWGRCTAAILSEHDEEVLLINAYEDITEQRTYHETLQQTQEELQTLNRRLMEREEVRTKFLSVVSHELRTPMAAIKGFIDNMLSGVTGPLNDRQSEYLRRMHSSMERLTRLIAQLLDWSRLEMGALPLQFRSIHPGALVRAVSENIHMIAEAKQIHVHTEIETQLPSIQADPDKLEQVLWNLVGNAIKFTPERGTVTMACRRASDGGIMLTVSDTGCGIPQHDLPHVFEQFSGVRSVIPAARGAQLGLYISKSLVQSHGGHIWVESSPGEGSRFFVHLPLTQPKRQNGGDPESGWESS